MANFNLKDLEAARAKVAQLEAAFAEERDSKLAYLPEEFGFDNVEEFITALRKAVKAGPKRGSTARSASVSAAPAKGKRARITPELKEQVKAAVEEGKTGAEIAEEFGISIPSVQNIKKEFGLVRTRG